MAIEVKANVNERSLVLAQYLDVALVVIAVAPVLVLGAPVLGFAVGAGGWILQRVIAAADRRWTRKVTAPVRQLGVTLFEGFARIWLLAGVIVIAAVVGGRRDGLTAALVILGAYSVAFVTKVVTGPPRQRALQ
ncbi:MAG: hypothetical protein ACRDY2_08685 [Acidimicrobiales bacterium]